MTATINVSVSPTSVTEAGTTNLTYTFTRTGDISIALTVNLELGGTATVIDYTSSISLATASGPAKIWTRLLGSSGTDQARALTTGLDGSIYVSGNTYGALDGQTNSGDADAFLSKYNVDGSKAWTRLLGSSGSDQASALTAGLDGSIYVSGNTYGVLDGQTNSGGADAFLTKYSADGTKAWTKLLGLSGIEYATALTTGLDGSIYVSGYTEGALDGQTFSGGSGDAFLTKYSADGTKAWTKLLGSSGIEYATALTTGLDGSIYVSGHTTGALDGQTKSGVNVNAFLTKYSADGAKAWTTLQDSSGREFVSALTTGLDGSIYVSGSTGIALDGQTNSGGYADAFLTKYSADGTKAWTKLLGSSGDDTAAALTTGLDGSIYVSGYTEGALDGQTHSGGRFDAFLTKYSAGGTKAWTKLLGSSGEDLAFALTTGLDGSIYVSGYTDGALDGQTNSGGTDAFLIKYLGAPQISFAAGSSTTTLALAPMRDTVSESTESLIVTVAAGTGYTVGGTANATGTIVDSNYPPTGGVTISGIAKQGQTLTVANTLADIDGLGLISYQWLTGGGIISGATGSSFALTKTQVGQAIIVLAGYTDALGTIESLMRTHGSGAQCE